MTPGLNPSISASALSINPDLRGILQIDMERVTAAVDDISGVRIASAGPVDPKNLRTHIGK
jgi:hypothetical protein